MRCTASRIIAAGNCRRCAQPSQKLRIITDQVGAIARQTLDIWLCQLALINPLIEPAASDFQFACQAWNGPKAIDHGDAAILMQRTHLAMARPEFVNGAWGDGEPPRAVEALPGELLSNLWVSSSGSRQLINACHQLLVIADIRLPVDRRNDLCHGKVSTDPHDFDLKDRKSVV